MPLSTDARRAAARGTAPHVATSAILARLIVDAPAERVTLAWLMKELRARSFGIILLLLGVIGLLPVVSPLAGLLLAIPAFQMIRGDEAPVFPKRAAARSVATAKLVAILKRVIPPLHYLERFVRPRWTTPFEATKRVVGGFVLLLGLGLLSPLPLSNIPIALVIMLIAFAYLEHDGVLLVIALALALALFGVAAGALWSTVVAALWLAR